MRKYILLSVLFGASLFAGSRTISHEDLIAYEEITSALEVYPKLQYALNLDLSDDQNDAIQNVDETLLDDFRSHPKMAMVYSKLQIVFENTIRWLQSNRDHLNDLNTYYSIPEHVNVLAVTTFKPEWLSKRKYVIKKFNEELSKCTTSERLVIGNYNIDERDKIIEQNFDDSDIYPEKEGFKKIFTTDFQKDTYDVVLYYISEDEYNTKIKSQVKVHNAPELEPLPLLDPDMVKIPD